MIEISPKPFLAIVKLQK